MPACAQASGTGGNVKAVSREVLCGIRWGGRSGGVSITMHCSGVQSPQQPGEWSSPGQRQRKRDKCCVVAVL